MTCPSTAVPEPGAVTPTGVTALTSGVIKQTEIQLFVPILGAVSPAEVGLRTGSGAAIRHLVGEGW